MKIAVIGCGTMGRVHGAELARMQDVQLVGMCDLDEDAACTLADQYNTRAFSDFDRMLAESEPDIVDICLPTYLHKEYVIRAAKQGKHVICEKPIALSLADADEMIDECKKQGVRLFVAHVVRFFPSYSDIRCKAAGGTIGKPAVLHARRMGGHPGLAKDWYNDSGKSGGLILDLMIHDIDFALAVFGQAESVYAMYSKREDVDYALVTLRFSRGQMAHLEGYWGYPGPFTTAVELAGTGGVVRFNSANALSLRKVTSSAGQSTVPVVAVPTSPSLHSPYYLELEHFIECVRSGQEPNVSTKDAFEALHVGLAAAESAAMGKPVRIGIYSEQSELRGDY